jgi:hypothetical protein
MKANELSTAERGVGSRGDSNRWASCHIKATPVIGLPPVKSYRGIILLLRKYLRLANRLN